jgi:hypothetical protein
MDSTSIPYRKSGMIANDKPLEAGMIRSGYVDRQASSAALLR